MAEFGRFPWGKGTPTWQRDATANDSDKSFTVPDNRIWILKSIFVEITSTATVGNRRMTVVINNGTNNIFTSIECGNLAASTTLEALWSVNSTYNASTGRTLLSLASQASASYELNIPEMILPAGYIVRVLDRAAIDAAADDMTVILHYIEYQA